MKDMKFRVHSPEHSEAIQEKLFELGYNLGRNVLFLNTDSNFLFATKEGSIYYNNLEIGFEEEYYKETTLDDLYKLKAEVSKEVYEDNQILKLREMAQDMLDAIEKLKED